RTLPAVSACSQWGYGQQFQATGYADPAISDAQLRTTGIIIYGQGRNWIIENNILSSRDYPILMLGNSAGRLDNFAADNAIIRGNIITDFDHAGIWLNAYGSVHHSDLTIEDNTIDGDPMHTHSNRSAGGKWGALAEPYAAMDVNTVNVGFRFFNNRIKNVAGLVRTAVPTAWSVRDNIVRCDPAALGFSTSNRGVG